MSQDRINVLIQLGYLVASALFIFGLKAMSSPRTARTGMLMAGAAMLAAMVGTMFDGKVHHYEGIAVGVIVGTILGGGMALWTPMTAMPQRTALSHAFGALAATLVGVAHYHDHADTLEVDGCILFVCQTQIWKRYQG